MRSELFIFLEIWIVICMTLFSTLLCHANQNNDAGKINRKLLQENTGDSICKSVFNFSIEALQNSENAFTVRFQLINPTFKNCFTYCNVFLRDLNKTKIQEKEVVYKYDENKIGSCVFENIPCGTYQIVVEPEFDDLMIARLLLTGGFINVTRCENNTPIIICVAVGCIALVAAFGALIHYFCRAGTNCASTNGTSFKNIKVYILYCSNKITRNKVDILKDFLLQSSYYSSVKTIEDDLSTILINPYNWISGILEEKDTDGNLNKIILIESEDDYEEDEFEIENFIFSEFLEKFSKNSSCCLLHHNNVFVAQLDESVTYFDRLKDIVRRHHFYVPEHLTDLCLKLCIGSKVDISRAEKKLERMFSNHQVRYLCAEQV